MNGSSWDVQPLIIHLHKKGSSIDVTNSVTSYDTIYFNNLDPNAKYYLQFSKRNDGQIFSFSGSIIEN